MRASTHIRNVCLHAHIEGISCEGPLARKAKLTHLILVPISCRFTANLLSFYKRRKARLDDSEIQAGDKRLVGGNVASPWGHASRVPASPGRVTPDLAFETRTRGSFGGHSEGSQP